MQPGDGHGAEEGHAPHLGHGLPCAQAAAADVPGQQRLLMRLGSIGGWGARDMRAAQQPPGRGVQEAG